MTPPINSHMPEKHNKNTVGQNKFTDFAKFEVEHTENPKTILATTSPNHPGDGAILRQNNFTSHIPVILGSERAASGPRQGRKNTRKCKETINLNKMFGFYHPTKMRLFQQFSVT